MASLALPCWRIGCADSRCRPRAAVCSLTWLLWLVPVASQQVKWQLSNAWKDASCDAVCIIRGLKCTEECWPSNVAGLEAAVKAPHLSGVCFQVAKGPAAIWNPAKAADNTFCHWNPGMPSGPRCPVVSQTSDQDSHEGRWTRRLCPCVNQTAAVISDCGLGPEMAAPVTSGSALAAAIAASAAAEAARAPQATTSTPAPTNAPTGQPASANYVAVPYACNLCVSGFDGDDQALNGRYVRSGPSWRYNGILLEKGTNGHWQFRERQMDGSYVPISQGSLLPSSTSMPNSDFFSTSTGGWTVDFSSCCGYASSSGESSAKGRSGGSAGISAVVIVLIVVALLAIAGIVAALVRYKWRARVQLPNDAAEDSKAGKAESSITLPTFTLPDGPDAELGGAGQDGNGRALRAAALSKTGAPSIPPVPPALRDCYSHGVYEGPVQPWWGEADNTRGSARQPPRIAGGWRERTGTPSDNAANRHMPSSGNDERDLGAHRVPMGAEAISMRSPDPGTGVTSWLASTPTSRQDNRSGSFINGSTSRPNLGNTADSWALPPRSGSAGISQAMPPQTTQQPSSRASRGEQPPMPPPSRIAAAAVGRSASTEPRLAPVASPSPQPRRSASSGPSGRVAPASAAMSLTPGGFLDQAQHAPYGLQDDLIKAQKRSQAKLAALKQQLAHG